jgi:hypothetical protein
MAATVAEAPVALSADLCEQIREFDTQWISRITATDRADRAAVEASFARFYQCRGLDAPRWFVWMDSPTAAAYAAQILAGSPQEGGRGLTAAQRDDIRACLDRQLAPLDVVKDAARSAAGELRTRQERDWLRDRLSFERFAFDAASNWRSENFRLRYQHGSRVAYLGEWLQELTWPGAVLPGWLLDWSTNSVAIRGRANWWPQPISTLTYPGDRLWWFLLHTRSGADDASGMYRDISIICEYTSYVQMLPSVVVLAENPTTLTFDRVGRLHNETGPAAAWSDSYGSCYAWHGIWVTEPAITRPVDLGVVVRERNVEVRRCLIERMGWDEFIRKAQLAPVGPAVSDPGNAPYTLQLYDLGHLFESSTRLPDSARLLLCTNGSAERDGTRRRYGLFVPGRHTDPIEAAAELYGVTANTYRRMQIRT